MHKLLLVALFFVLGSSLFAQQIKSVFINGEQAVINDPLLKITIKDVLSLLNEAGISNDTTGGDYVKLTLKKPYQPKFKQISYTPEDSINFYYPDVSFRWTTVKTNEGIEHILQSPSYEGISYGLYALLQEKLGFAFYHPRKMFIPDLSTGWFLDESFQWEGTPKFRKRGYHYHSTHPVELSSAFLEPTFPNGIHQIKEYIDWLARTGQNFFRIKLLRTIDDVEEWVEHARIFTDYAHQRGLFVSLSVSMNQFQQKHFMLYRSPLIKFKSKRKQIFANLEKLLPANFDTYSIDLASSEKTTGNLMKKNKLAIEIQQWAEEKHIKIFSGALLKGNTGELIENDELKELVLSQNKMGGGVHTVMCYSLNDEKAPVYGNKNFHHLRELLLIQQQNRETWYHPEAAYWVSFDNSVPMLLLPYLSARLDDINYCDSIDLEGHITFSTGWEWGYWLVEWSITRWSWDYGVENKPEDGLSKLFANKKIGQHFGELIKCQDYYLKEKELMRYLAAQTVTDELPFVDMEFQPRPKWKYKYLFRKAPQHVLDTLQNHIQDLKEFVHTHDSILEKMKSEPIDNVQEEKVFSEIYQALKVTQLRIEHRIQVLSAIHSTRQHKINKNIPNRTDEFISKATQIRLQALKIVKERENNYAYDKALLSTRYKNPTVYHFGYLYPVSMLHFWQREEQQVIKNKWGYGFMNIWDILRNIGLK